MKTLRGWEKSRLILTEYLTEPCQIDEELYHYIGEVVAPRYCARGLSQLGEAEFSDDYGTMHHMTVSCVNDKYFYLGILPAFHQ